MYQHTNGKVYKDSFCTPLGKNAGGAARNMRLALLPNGVDDVRAQGFDAGYALAQQQALEASLADVDARYAMKQARDALKAAANSAAKKSLSTHE